MSTPTASQFLSELKSNAQLRSQISGAKNLQAIAEVANKNGFNVTEGQLFQNLSSSYSKVSETELDSFLGSGDCTWGSFCGSCFTDPNSSRGCIC